MPSSRTDLQARLQELRRALPPISYPAWLPVSQHRAELADAINANQVVIIAGETGSGKTTQLPKICLDLGRGQAGQIGHTQPRRIAARSVAERIASELRTELGTAVGYQVRFADTTSDGTLIKLMTDGILLTELQRDRKLLRYDTLIIDEAHERSLNIDFILGYLKRLLPRRPDLKVIITSATIDPQRFSQHFWDAPVLEVSGRSYPVQVRYRPLTDPDSATEPRDQVQGILDAVAELKAAGPGDILVFLSGEREIRDAADALAGQQDLELLPLYARLSAAEQHKVFAPHGGSRRVVLATNVAETSLTVPGIRYVVDPGTARISRYSQRTKVQRLPIEPISQASARQRAGRCGRTADGICVRLYSEEDFDSRPEFTDPEILRTNLASVLLRMAALELGDVADFPFVDPPDARNIADGYRLLAELGATQPKRQGKLTSIGRKLARLPADPRFGRMILESAQHGCVREVLIIAAALSIQDPRERPADARQAVDQLHRRFAEPDSDFLALVNLWEYLREQQRALSASAFRRLCRREYLHYLRVREWQDVYAQLRTAAHEVGVGMRRRTDQPGDLADRVHMSLLAGLLSHIGMQDTDVKSRQPASGRRPLTEFAGARGARFAIFPDSALARKPPPWLVAAELVETARLWARTVAKIDPAWAEPLAPHLTRHSYSEPRWDADQGAAIATEKVVLYGLPIVPARRVNLASIDARLARDLFITHALVEGDWQASHRFLAANQRLAAEAEALERKARRRGLVADDAAVFAFYDQRIPADVVSARHFDSWWKDKRRTDPELLTMTEADLAGPLADQVEADDYPESLAGYQLSYQFQPGEPDDGVTVHIPLARLGQASAEEFGWQVPGLREELVTELIRSLPKQLRTAFVPAPDTARAVLARLQPNGDLLAALSTELQAMTGVTVPRSAWDLGKLPPHLRIRYQVTDGGTTLATGTDLDELRAELRPRLRDALNAAAADVTTTGLTSWTIGDLPRVISRGQLRAYPALTDAGRSVDVALYESAGQAERAMRLGTRRLIMLQVPARARSIAGRLPVADKLAMSRHPYPSVDSELADCVACATDQVIADAGGPAWDAAGFGKLLEAARWELPAVTATVIEQVAHVLGAAHEAEAALPRTAADATLPRTAADATLPRKPGPELAAAIADIRGQLAGLIYPGFVADAGAARLPDLVRYLQAIVRRLGKLALDPRRDAELMATVHRVSAAYRQTLADLPPGRADSDESADGRWLIEELRVSLFAQTLGTPFPVSEKRITTWLTKLRQQANN